jgi:translation initiation factor 2A
MYTRLVSLPREALLSRGSDRVCFPDHYSPKYSTNPLLAKQEDGHASKNLKVFRTENAEPITAFVQKSQTGWNLQYTFDEKYCARAVTNEIQFYESHKMDTVWGHLRVEGVADFALSPGKNYSIAAFVPERKGQPAFVKVFQVPNWTMVLSQKSFYKADRVQLKWNDLGTALLVFAQTDADKTGKNYYGETNLYLMTVAGNYDCRVQLGMFFEP